MVIPSEPFPELCHNVMCPTQIEVNFLLFCAQWSYSIAEL